MNARPMPTGGFVETVLLLALVGCLALAVGGAKAQLGDPQPTIAYSLEFPEHPVPVGESFWINAQLQTPDSADTVGSFALRIQGCDVTEEHPKTNADYATYSVNLTMTNSVCSFVVVAQFTNGQVDFSIAGSVVAPEAGGAGAWLAGAAWLLWMLAGVLTFAFAWTPLRIVVGVVGLSVLFLPVGPLQFTMLATGQGALLVTVIVQSMTRGGAD